MLTVAYNWKYISMLGDCVSRDEYIDQKHGQVGTGFSALFTWIENTENMCVWVK
jgi:hypothetical protein